MESVTNQLLSALYKASLFLLILNAGYLTHAQEMHSDNTPPVYSEGIDSLQAYIQKNLVFPVKENTEGISGIVTVGFTITKAGNIENVHVVKGLDADYDKEAVRIVSGMKGWKPAVQWGVPVNTEVMLPVSFLKDSGSDPAENTTISGKITDECTGEPLKGILVLVWGSNLGTITDENGTFKLNVAAGKDKLEILSTEYCRKVVHIESSRRFNIALEKEVYTVDFETGKIKDSSEK
jgi:TonB family protein